MPCWGVCGTMGESQRSSGSNSLLRDESMVGKIKVLGATSKGRNYSLPR